MSKKFINNYKMFRDIPDNDLFTYKGWVNLDHAHVLRYYDGTHPETHSIYPLIAIRYKGCEKSTTNCIRHRDSQASAATVIRYATDEYFVNMFAPTEQEVALFMLDFNVPNFAIMPETMKELCDVG